VLDQGRVIEVGDPRALLTQSGPYQHIVASYEGAASMPAA